MSARTLVVSGASGQLGRRVVELLLEADAGAVVAVTRNPGRLADLSRRGATVRPGDFDDPASLDQAFAGGERLLLISTDRLGHRVQQHANAVAVARRAGIRHIAYTSLPNPIAGSPILVADDHRRTEEEIRRSGLGWTFLRNNLYMDLLPMTLAPALDGGPILDATGGGGAAYVSREDCARVAAAVLAAPSLRDCAVDVTGPEVVTFADLARIATQLFGRIVEVRPTNGAGLRRAMFEGGTPEAVADVLASFQEGMARGLLEPASTAVVEWTGRDPVSAEEFLDAHRETLLAARS